MRESADEARSRGAEAGGGDADPTRPCGAKAGREDADPTRSCSAQAGREDADDTRARGAEARREGADEARARGAEARREGADEARARGAEAFREGRFFEAHEHWEDAWRALPDGEERRRVHGQLHLAVALYQHERGRRRGAARQLEKARRKLADHADLRELVEQVAAVLSGAPVSVLALEGFAG